MDAVAAAVANLTGRTLRASRALHGGCLSRVDHLTLDDGTFLVAKTGPMVAREARMLAAIRAAGADAPTVLGVHGDVLLIEALEETGPVPAGWAALGRGLRKLHRTTGRFYGWDEDYAFGPVPVRNTGTDTWPDFWAEHRLLADPGALPADLAQRVESLAARLPGLFPRRPRAALLHGDLWGGNVLFSGARAWLIDPACYFGDPEVDLAMLHLFGQPDPAFTEAYGPLAPGWRDRRALYQLWPALVHLRLFGSGYRGMVEARLAALGA